MTRDQSFELAFSEQRERLNRKNAEYRAKVDALSVQNSRFEEIGRALSALGAKTAITALSGNMIALGELQKKISDLSKERADILKNAGIKEVTFDCAACSDTGYINGKICECIKKRAKAIMIDALSQNLPLNNCRFDNFELKYYPETQENGVSVRKAMTEVFKLCREYALSFEPNASKSMLFLGNTGIGKTHLSLAIVTELLEKGFNVIYGSAYNLFSEMESEHFGEHTNKKYEAAISCDLLVIDDLGSEFVSPFIQTLLYNIVNTRLLAHRPTIINTNLTVSEIGTRYSPRVASRFIGEYTMKRFLGNDIRQLKAIEKNV